MDEEVDVSQDLRDMRENAAKAYIYTCLSCDTTEVFLILLTAVALLAQCWQARGNHARRRFTFSIILQMVLMFA